MAWALLWLLARVAGAEEAPVVAAASDLRFALVEVSERFRRETGDSVRLSFGSSGSLRQQIAQGAPYALFLSADEAYVAALAREGRTLDEGVPYAEGRIAIIVPRGSRLRADGTLRDLAAALTDGRLRRLAIANPEHAPYGRAAREALRHAGLWEATRARLVLGENVSQAAQFATSGSTDGGIIAYSLARSPRLQADTASALIPAEWHRPLRQRMVLLKRAGATARAFYAYLRSPDGRAILARWGFRVPAPGAP